MTRLIPLIALLACNGGKTPPENAAEGTTPAGTEHTDPSTGPAEADPAPEKPAETPFDTDSFGDMYWLSAEPAPSVEDNIFRAVARHGGGCAEHEFTINWTGTGRSQPPTALGALVHNANGDKCRALLITPIEIDLGAALADQRCIGAVSLATPPADSEKAAGGALRFEIDALNCEEPETPAP